MRFSRRQFLGGAAGLLLAACAPAPSSRPTAPPIVGQPKRTETATGQPFTPVLANSELVVGKSRFAMGLIGGDNRPITDATVRFEFFVVQGQTATKRFDADAAFRFVDLPQKGTYAATVSFDTPGPWGVQVVASRPGQDPQLARANFEVLASSASPTIGKKAVPSKSPTVRDVKDPAEICTNVPPCDMHELSIADALAQQKPLVVLFATPGFCTSQTCAPQLGVVQQLKAQYGGRANFIHVEIYKDPRNRVVADAVNEWRLPSEPWVFLVGKDGVIADRFEGAVPLVEIEPALKALLG